MLLCHMYMDAGACLNLRPFLCMNKPLALACTNQALTSSENIKIEYIFCCCFCILQLSGGLLL